MEDNLDLFIKRVHLFSTVKSFPVVFSYNYSSNPKACVVLKSYFLKSLIKN